MRKIKREPLVVLHMVKEQNAKEVVVKCGAPVIKQQTTVWWREVTCPICASLPTLLHF